MLLSDICLKLPNLLKHCQETSNIKDFPSLVDNEDNRELNKY